MSKYTETQLLAGLLELCGHVQNGSDTTVKLFQDDATFTYHVKVGDGMPGCQPRSYYGEGWRGVITEAIDADPEAKAIAERAAPRPVGYMFGNSYWEEGNPRLTDEVRKLGTPRYGPQYGHGVALNAAENMYDGTTHTPLRAAVQFLRHDGIPGEGTPHRIQVGTQFLTRVQVADLLDNVRLAGYPPTKVEDWMRVLVFNEMKERLALPSNDEAAIGPWETLHELMEAAGAQKKSSALMDDGRRFRQLIALLLAAFKHEEIDDAGPHPALVRLKALAEPTMLELEDSDDTEFGDVMAKVPNLVRTLLDQLKSEGF